MISDALNIAANALAAQQQAIDVISQNVSNVNTPGYSRQTPEMAALSPTVINGLSIGNGATVDNIQRAANPILNQAIAGNDSQVAYWQAMQQGLSGLNAAFGSIGGTTLSSSLDSFFQAFPTLANNTQNAGTAASQQAVVTSDAMQANRDNALYLRKVKEAHQALCPSGWEKGKVSVDEQSFRVPDELKSADFAGTPGI